MKKLLPLLLPLCLAAAPALAQSPGGVRIGVKAGGTYANLVGDDVQRITGPNYDAALDKRYLGFNVGLSVQIPVSSDGSFCVQPEVLLNRRGYTIDVDQKSGLPAGVSKYSFEQTRVLTYLDVPVLARVYAGGLFFELGPQFGYLVRASSETQTTTKYANGDKDKVEDSTGDGKSDLASADLGGVAGIGYQTPGGLSLSLRYNRGFNSLIDSKDTDNDLKAFNDAFLLQVGYLLPLGK
ncbi:porin family protein [Hymenobacter aquaticus]|uniref:porin family protein n=1 Tax=Hymenobacter aquaticus TaxID=1867101 RepID=UPI001436A437|nr:porin family protein [Hymenobacter aquaticus]